VFWPVERWSEERWRGVILKSALRPNETLSMRVDGVTAEKLT